MWVITDAVSQTPPRSLDKDWLATLNSTRQLPSHPTSPPFLVVSAR